MLGHQALGQGALGQVPSIQQIAADAGAVALVGQAAFQALVPAEPPLYTCTTPGAELALSLSASPVAFALAAPTATLAHRLVADAGACSVIAIEAGVLLSFPASATALACLAPDSGLAVAIPAAAASVDAAGEMALAIRLMAAAGATGVNGLSADLSHDVAGGGGTIVRRTSGPPFTKARYRTYVEAMAAEAAAERRAAEARRKIAREAQAHAQAGTAAARRAAWAAEDAISAEQTLARLLVEANDKGRALTAALETAAQAERIGRRAAMEAVRIIDEEEEAIALLLAA